MSKYKFTAGSWTLGNGQVRVRTEKDEQGRSKMIAECYTTLNAGRYPNQEEREANARLISAAPDLLKAVELLLELIPSMPAPPHQKEDAIRTARQAIGKAIATGNIQDK